MQQQKRLLFRRKVDWRRGLVGLMGGEDLLAGCFHFSMVMMTGERPQFINKLTELAYLAARSVWQIEMFITNLVLAFQSTFHEERVSE
jgi:hypothetical protein